MLEKLHISVVRFARIMDSWLIETPTLDAITAELTKLSNRKNLKKIPCFSS